MLNILKYVKKYWYFAVFAPLFMLVEVMMDMMMANYMQKIVDFGIQVGNLENVIKYGLIMLLLLFIGVVFGILSGVFTNLVSYKFSNDLRKDVFHKILKLSFNQIDQFETGSLITRVTNDITQIQNMVSMALRMMVRSSGMFVLGIVFTLKISSQFSSVLLVALPLEILLMIIFMKKVFPVFGRIQKKLDKVNTVVHENVSGARVVKAFCKEEDEYKRFVSCNDDYTAESLYVSKIAALLNPLLTLIVFSSQIFIYNLGGKSIFDAYNNQMFDGMLMIGEISQANTYISMICMSLIMVGMQFTNFARSFVSIKRVNEILLCELEIKEGHLENVDNFRQGEIEFRNVSFKYENAHDYVLENISFKINKGETIAIVGATGAGKTSLINLIPRFYDYTSGEILLNGINVRDYKLEELRKRISVCLQRAELFSGTIRENIVWGKEDATEEEILEAAEISQSLEIINNKPNKFDEYIEERGTSLSGGQKQRISIARAIIKNPEVLIFDDSTSALDLITESKLHEGLRKKKNNVTKIIVAQRVATAKNADKIIVLDNGRIVDFDTHENLLLNCEIYKNIYESQLKRDGEINE